MKLSMFLVAALFLAASGCVGLPEGSADTGDTVTIRYTTIDTVTGEELRTNRTATFVVGSGESGLGLGGHDARRSG